MEGQPPVPPYSNTGVQNTSGNALIALVDWVSVTFPAARKWTDVLPVLNLDSDTFSEMKTGMNGYKQQHKRGNISILSDGNADMGVHVIMSGQGCREYENDPDAKPWNLLFAEVFFEDGHFARLDLAIDDYKGFYKPEQIVKKLEAGLTTSKFKSYRYMKKGRISDGSSKGITVYLGSDSSDIQIRIYDKLQERQEAGKTVNEDVTHWTRTEVQLADKRADMAAHRVIEEQDENVNIGIVVAGILKNYFCVLDKPTGDSNKSRWPVWPRWKAFLGDVAKLKLTLLAPDRTIDTRRAWIDKQTAKTLGMLFVAYDSDLNWLVDTLNKGMDLLEARDLDEIETYKRNKKLLDKYFAKMRLESGDQSRFNSFDDYLIWRTTQQQIYGIRDGEDDDGGN